MHRSSREVAVKAIIFGSLGFRASLEVTDHPRCATLCPQLLPWLEQLNLGDQITEFYREILETPHRELPRESQTEAYWRGEAAAILGWTIGLFDKPDPAGSVDVGELFERLRILNPTAQELVSNARLRPESEIAAFCAFCVTVRQRFQVAAVDEDGQSVLQRLHQTRLDELGLREALDRHPDIELDAVELVSRTPRVKGLFVVRALACEWLLGKDL